MLKSITAFQEIAVASYTHFLCCLARGKRLSELIHADKRAAHLKGCISRGTQREGGDEEQAVRILLNYLPFIGQSGTHLQAARVSWKVQNAIQAGSPFVKLILAWFIYSSVLTAPY